MTDKQQAPNDVRKHCEFGGMIGPVSKIVGMSELKVSRLVATQGRFEQIKKMSVDAVKPATMEAMIFGIPVYRCDNDADAMATALELAETTDEVWLALDAASEIMLLTKLPKNRDQQKGGE